MALYLIDGNSYVYRAFYAIKAGLTDAKGRPTNAVYGFTSMLMKIIREKKPDGLIISFDTKGPTERHTLFEHYKAHRPETPPDLIAQMPLVKEVIDAMNIGIYEMPGYEADDILATLAKEASEKGLDVFIVTGDKDMLQLVTDKVRVYDPMKEKIYGRAEVIERFGVPPERVTEYMALAGDPTDNIPGVKGIGEKTAKELLSSFKSLDEILAHPEKIQKERIRKLVTEGIDDIHLSKRLAEINSSVPIRKAHPDFSMREPDWDRVRSVFRELGFHSFLSQIPGKTISDIKAEAVFDEERLKQLLSHTEKEFAFDTETTGVDPIRDGIVGFSFSFKKGEGYYVPLAHDYEGAPKQMEKAKALGLLRPILEDEEVEKTGHNLKFDILVLRKEGIETRGRLYDTMVAAYLLNPLRADHSLENASLEHLGRTKSKYSDIAGKGGFENVDIEEGARYAALDAELGRELRGVLFQKIKDERLDPVYFDIEMPLICILADMEEAGMKIDTEKLGGFSKELERELSGIEKRIYFIAGEEFNIGSPKQLGKILFEGLGLTPGKRKKTGFSTDVSVLEELSRVHELPREVLNWRSLTKLKSTYVDSLPELLNPSTGRLHTSFNQTATSTGRLSSSEPNLQNIPVRGEWGRKIREAFIAEEGNVLITADYSQIELRILAHLSGDDTLTDAFLRGEDVHTTTAASIFGVKPEKVTTEMRRAAKTVNFGVIYGMSSFGLSEALSIPKSEAAKYIEEYFRRHDGVKRYLESVIADAEKTGISRTLTGRLRPIPEIKQKGAMRSLGERLAVNSPIQGSAADIIKIAMINISQTLKKESMRTRMILQVHDELLFEAPHSEIKKAREIVRKGMEEAFALRVPLRVEMGEGGNWASAGH